MLCRQIHSPPLPLVIAVRVSGGHLCEAEAPTEPVGETADRCAAIFFPTPLSLRSRVNGCGNPSSFRGLRILSRYALRMTYRLVIANTYGVRLYFRLPVIAIEFTAFVPLVIARGFSPAAIRSLSKGLRILSCYALRMTGLFVIASEQSERGNPLPLLSGGFILTALFKHRKNCRLRRGAYLAAYRLAVFKHHKRGN